MGSLSCRIELNKKEGIIVTVKNGDKNITQTMKFDGEAITTTCKGPSETSEITQKSESIVIKCKNFELTADTIKCTSEGLTKFESGKTFDVKSTGGLTLKTDQNFQAIAEINTSIEATAKADFKGKLTTVTGSLTKVEGNLVKLG